MHVPGVAMNMSSEPTVLGTIDNGMQMVCQAVEIFEILHNMTQ
jgi:hypothetical protein